MPLIEPSQYRIGEAIKDIDIKVFKKSHTVDVLMFGYKVKVMFHHL